MGTLQVTKTRANGGHQHFSLHLLLAHSRQITATITNTHELQLFSSVVCTSLLWELSLRAWHPKLTSYSKFTLRLNTGLLNTVRGLLEQDAASVDVLALSFPHIQCTKPNLSREWFILIEILQGGASGRLLLIMDCILNATQRSLIDRLIFILGYH